MLRGRVLVPKSWPSWRKTGPDLHRCRSDTLVQRCCAHEVCTGIMHTMAAQDRTTPSTPTTAGPSDDENVWLTPESVRVLAHPLRSRLLGALRRHGPSTATDLATLLGTNSGATSYHLRKLETVGLVSDTGEGEGKRRLWRAATDFHSFYASDFAGDEDSETALNWLSRDYVRHFAAQAERWVDASPSWPPAWQDACGSSDDMVLLTAEQLSAMRDEIGEVVTRYRRVGQGNPEAK